MKKGPRFGTSIQKPDPAVCMVIGCEKKALYRSGSRAQRGYCALHRSYAVPQLSVSSEEQKAAYLLREWK